MKPKALYLLSLLIVVVAAINIAILCIADANTPARPLGQPKNGSDTIIAFFDAMRAGDHDAAEEYLAGSVSLGSEELPENEVSQKIITAVRESYRYTLVGDFCIDGMTAVQQVQFTYFDIESANDTLAQYSQELYESKIASASANDELYDANGNLHEHIALEIFNSALERLISEKESFLSTTVIDIELQYDSGDWKIVFSDALADLLLGGLYI